MRWLCYLRLCNLEKCNPFYRIKKIYILLFFHLFNRVKSKYFVCFYGKFCKTKFGLWVLYKKIDVPFWKHLDIQFIFKQVKSGEKLSLVSALNYSWDKITASCLKSFVSFVKKKNHGEKYQLVFVIRCCGSNIFDKPIFIHLPLLSYEA